MIHLKKLTLEGVGSMIKQVEFNLDREGLTILRGDIGSGKTSIPSGLTWVFFGKNLKPKSTIETWPERRTKEYKGSMGKVEFTKDKDNYEIIRCISYKGKVYKKVKGASKLMIIKNGELLGEKRDKKQVQALITEIIGYSYDLFINSIIFGQRLTKLIEESGPNKKKIFDEAFETVFIDRAKTKVDKERKDTQFTLKDYDAKLDNLIDSYEETEKLYNDTLEWEKSFKTNNEKERKKKKKTISELQEKNIELKNNILELKLGDKDKLKSKLKKLEKKKSKLQKVESKVEKLDNTIQETVIELDNFSRQDKSLIENKCYACNQVLPKSEKLRLTNDNQSKRVILEKELLEYRIKLHNLTSGGTLKQLKKLNHEIESISKTYFSHESNSKTKHRYSEIIKSNKEAITEYKKELEDLKREKLTIKSKGFHERLQKTSSKIESLRKKYTKLEKTLEIQDWLIKDPLSNGGLKAYIFNSLLDKVNDRLASYNDILGFRIEFGIDLESANKDFYQMIFKGDIIINYPDLSGGQKQLVDTSIALALHDVISSIRPMSLLFMDEPFEGLNSTTIETVSEIITHKSREQNVFLITHHDSFNPTNSNTIYFKIDDKGQSIISA